MQVFKTFMKIMKKHLRTSIIYIIVFLAIGIGMSLSDDKKTGFENSRLNISVIDNDNTEASRALIEFIDKNHTIVDVGNSKDEMLDALYYLRANVILTINEGYAEKLANGETDDLFSDYRVPGTFTAEYFDTQMNQYISTINAYTTGGFPIEKAAKKTAVLMENEVKAEIISPNEKKDSSLLSDKISQYFNYFAYVIIMVIISGLCPTILVMTSKEIRNRTNCSSISSSSQLLQIALGSVIFSIGVYLLLTCSAAILYGSEIFSKNGLLGILNSFVFLIFAMTLTIFIAVIAPSSNVVNMIANIVGLGMSFLCGVFVPQMLLSDTVLNVGKFLPAYWYVKANNMLSGSNNEIFSNSKFFICIGIEIAFSVMLFCITILAAKTKRSSKSV